LDWRLTNATTWEGRAIVGGQVSKSRQNVILTTNVLKQALDLPLSPEEQRAEKAFLRSEHG
jgi:DNA sulfur modification protein DndB